MSHRPITSVILLAMLAVVPYGCRDGKKRAAVPVIATPKGHLPNIIVLTVDTLRADHMQLHGYERDTMPAVEAFAETAVVFDNAVVPRGSTRPSYASMLTGLYPYRHGVRSNEFQLHEALTTLPEILQEAGYHTAGFVSNFVLIAELSGLGQGFDLYDDRIDDIEYEDTNRRYDNYERKADETLKAILAWLDSEPSEPFFLFTNFIDPHGPYTPPPRFRRMYRSEEERLLPVRKIPAYQLIEGEYNFYDYVDRYDAEIRFTDEALGILIEELKGRDLWEDSLVVFTADHGEFFGAHGLYFEHHLHVWEETVHVPLAIRLPESAKNHDAIRSDRSRSLASPLDLPPTILDYLRLSSDIEFNGESLLPVIAGADQADRDLLLECYDIRTGARTRGNMYALRTPTHKLIRIVDHETKTWPGQVLYHVREDRTEQHPIQLNAENELHRELSGRFDEMLAAVIRYELPFQVTKYDVPLRDRRRFVDRRQVNEKVIRKQLTTRQVKRLRSLGYLE